MRLTKAAFHKLYQPPAIVLTINDTGCSVVDLLEDQPPWIGLVAELHHPELPRPYRQLFRLSIDQARELGFDLLAHVDAEINPPADEE